MKILTANMTAHIAQRSLSLANMWKLTRADGTVMGFTDHDLPLDFNDGTGTITYEALGGLTASALSSSNALRVDTQDSAGMITSDRITTEDLRAGRYDNAVVRHFKVNHQDLSGSMGDIKMKVTRTGQVEVADQLFTVELRSLSQHYSQRIIDLLQPACGVDLGSDKCGVRLNPPLWQPGTAYTVREDRDAKSGAVVKPSVFNDRFFKCIEAGVSATEEPIWNTVLGGTTATNATDDNGVIWEAIQATTIPDVEIIEVINKGEFWINYTGDAPNELFNLGIVTAVTGRNIGLFREIKDFDQASDGPARVKTFLPFSYPLQGGISSTGPDLLELKAGCEKDRDVCKRLYDNIENHHGFPDLPGNDRLYLTPDQPSN